MADNKRFSDWEEVNCNECTHYWDDSCTGVCKGQKRNCTSFVATRSVVIPQQIKALQKQITGLKIALALLGLVVGVLIGVIV